MTGIIGEVGPLVQKHVVWEVKVRRVLVQLDHQVYVQEVMNQVKRLEHVLLKTVQHGIVGTVGLTVQKHVTKEFKVRHALVQLD